MELNKIILLNLNKHFIQIRKGGMIVIVKKLISIIYLISIPTIIVIRLIRPYFLIRWQQLKSSRIGHFAIETELYCCRHDAGIDTPSQRHIDFFYFFKEK